MRKEKITSLTGIRSILAIQILSYHYAAVKGSRPCEWFDFLWESPGIVVGMFFMMSGFLTAYVYKKTIEELSFKQYLWRRTKNIIIPVFLITTIAIAFWAVEYYGLRMYEFEEYYIKPFSIIRIVTSYLNVSSGWLIDFFPMDGPLWYMNVVMLCELLYWLVARCLKNGLVRKFTYIGFILLGMACYILNLGNIPFLYATSDGVAYLGFFMGVLVYEFYVNDKLHWSVGLVLMVIGIFIPNIGSNDVLLRYWTLVLGCLILLLCCKPVADLVSNRFFMWLGNLSLAIYMVHEPLQDLTYAFDLKYGWNIDTGSLAVYLISTLITIILAMLFDKLVKACSASKFWQATVTKVQENL